MRAPVAVTAGATYYYRFAASNAAGFTWADNTETFITGEVSLQIGNGSASEDGPASGTVLATRPGPLTNEALTAWYEVSGTASNGADYLSLPGSVVIPAGETQAVITVAPIDDAVWGEGTEDVVLTLREGGYVLGAARTATVHIADNEPPSGWSHSMRVTFTGYDHDEPLTNFPALVVFDTNITNFAYSQFASSNGWDLRFADAAGTRGLNYEIEQWNPGGSSYVWVQVPVLAPGAAVWAYWGNAGAKDVPLPCTTNGATWSPDYAGVWHMAESDPNSPCADSAIHANHGVLSGAPEFINGVAAGAKCFPGSTPYSYMRSSQNVSAVTGAVPRTVSLWVKPVGAADPYGYIFTLGTNAQFGGAFAAPQMRYNSQPSLFLWTHNDDVATDDSLPADEWSYLAVTYDGATVGFHLNGDRIHSGATNLYTLPNPAYLGYARWQWPGWGDGSDAAEFPFCADEFRIAGAEHSSNWLQASYMTMASNSAFTVYAVPRRPGMVLTLR